MSMSLGQSYTTPLPNTGVVRWVYASSAETWVILPPSERLLPLGPSATVMRRPSRMNVKTSPYFSRQSKRNAYGSMPYDAAEPNQGMMWKTTGGSVGSLGRS